MIVPWGHGFKNVKWLQHIRLTNDYRAADTYASLITVPVMVSFAWLYDPIIFVRVGRWVLRTMFCWPVALYRCCRRRASSSRVAPGAVAPAEEAPAPLFYSFFSESCAPISTCERVHSYLAAPERANRSFIDNKRPMPPQQVRTRAAACRCSTGRACVCTRAVHTR